MKATRLIPLALALLAATTLAWTTPEPIISAGVHPELLALADGRWFLVWVSHSAEGGHDIQAAFGDQDGWGDAMPVSSDPLMDTGPVCAEDGFGGIWVAWMSRRNVGPGSAGRDVYTRRYDGTGWGAVQPVDLDPGNDSDLALTTDSDGRTWLFWSGERDGDRAILAATHDGTAWEPERLVVDEIGDDRWPQVAAGPAGELWLAWTTSGSGREQVAVRRWDGATWSGTEILGTGSGSCARPRLDLTTGQAPICVWEHRSGVNGAIELRRWSGSAWGGLEVVSEDGIDLDREYGPTVVCDDDGIWVSWYGYDDRGNSDWRDNGYDILARRHTSSGWEPTELLTQSRPKDLAPRLARNIAGEVLLLWMSDQGGGIYQSLAEPGSGSVPRAVPPRMAGPVEPEVWAPLRSEQVQQTLNRGTGQVDGPAGCFFDSGGNLLVARSDLGCVERWARGGILLQTLGATAPGGLNQPLDVVEGMDGRVFVIDSGDHRLVVFNGDGSLDRVIGGSGSAPGLFLRPSGLGIGSGALYVADTGNHRIQVLALDGTFLSQFGSHGVGPGELVEPLDVLEDQAGLLWVADTWNHRLQRFQTDGTLQGELDVGVYQPRQLCQGPQGSIFYIHGSGQIKRVDPGTNCIEIRSDGEPVGWDDLWGVAVRDDGLVVVTDRGAHRIRATDRELTREVSQPRILALEEGTARLGYSSLLPDPGRIDFGPWDDGGYPEMVWDPFAGTGHDLDLPDLAPGTAYRYRLHYRDPWSLQTRTLENLIFTTATGPVQADYQRIRTLLLIYRRFVYRTHPIHHEEWIDPDEQASIEAHADEVREFYWRSTRGRLDLDLQTVEYEPAMSITDGDFAPAGCALPDDLAILWPENVKHQLLRLGIDPDSFDNIVAVLPFRCYSDYGTGIFSWGCARDLWGGRGLCAIIHCWPENVPWYMVHEGHHNLDGMMKASGFPEYEHADILYEMEGTFGESWAANGYMARQWNPDQWFGYRFGHREPGLDFDGDRLLDQGVPPVTEATLGSSPTLVDSDGDGLGDADEAFHGYLGWTDLTRTDTDEDGRRDGIDPHPRYPMAEVITPFTPVIDGWIEPGWPSLIQGFLAEVSHPDCDIESLPVSMGWDAENLYLAFQLDRPAWIRIKLDGAWDAWFHGRENIEIELDPATATVRKAHVLDSSPEQICAVGYALWSDSADYPFDPPLATGDIQLGIQPDGGGFQVEVAIPALPDAGFLLEPNRPIGLKIELDRIEGNSQWTATLFERDSFVGLPLGGPGVVPATGLFGLFLLAAGLAILLRQGRS